MTRQRVPLLGALIVAVALTASGPGRAFQTPAQEQPPTFRTEANYVRVDVYPTANGVPVTDLQQADFEVFEDGAPQRIDAFERIAIRGPQPEVPRVEPNTIAESRAMLDNPRARVFVIFLDIGHVDVLSARAIRQPLISFLNRAIGPDDLVGVMTPEMSAADISFARRTATIEGILTRHWTWGERDRTASVDPREELYKQCYPGFGPTLNCPDDDRGIADELIKRYRENQTLDALENLVRYLRTLREERKAVIAITQGWLLYAPNPALTRRVGCREPERPRVGVGPDGTLSTTLQQGVAPPVQCEADRMTLSRMDSEPRFRQLFDMANRANASFYPVDPRGLAAFDTSLGEPRTGLPPAGSSTITPLQVDRSMLQARLSSLNDLAFATDGLAVVNTNDLDNGLRRVTADLSSYYLLGYYSTGKFDGRFHSISVRIKRPGVQVRARRGYLAPTTAEASSTANRTAPVAPADAAAAAEARAIEVVLGTLGGVARGVPIRLQAAAGWKPDNAPSVVVVGEVEWKGGGDADVMLTSTSGDTLATARASLASGVRSFRVALTPSVPIEAGDYSVRVRAREAGAVPTTAELRVTLPAVPSAQGALFWRRGPSTGNREAPTADLRFRRTEQLRVDLLAAGRDQKTARLLDRSGKPMPLPVSVALRDDSDGTRWTTAQVSLAPLSAGDYLIEIGGGGAPQDKTLIAFRIVP